MYICTPKNANEIWESHKIVNFQIYNELKKIGTLGTKTNIAHALRQLLKLIGAFSPTIHIIHPSIQPSSET